ncbi:phosphotransferase [Sphingomonas sp. CGMCC 1.13654]|uniref:Phosphotransferase n=1 Tax=Sphingomonas chungangi TaxID=2683589 RepID=A0A838L0E3_9SPHN|nr:phosphotransferase [Sphingomonas chungangi]MBA2932684.1 phosphotransferase [Sphingomonas chungangi]MVW56306.1 phosphotransferase [Sphingomonas chungangi]
MPATAGHLVHGMGTAMEAPTWPAITPSEAEAVLRRFPAAGRLIGLRWHSPRPFSAATLVQTSRGEFFLKRHHRLLRSPEGLAEEHGFIAHLRAAGISVPDIMTTTTKAGAVADGEWTYELHRRAPGADLYRDRLSWTPFLSHDHAHAAGAMLARLHRAARGYEAPARRPQPLVASATILNAADPLMAAEAYVGARPALAAFLSDRPWRAQLSDLFGALGEGLPERLAAQPSLWTHNDWHPSNLLWAPDGTVSAVFDFGLATRTSALHDFATAIERTAVEWLRLGEDGIADAGTVAALVAGYRTVLPLTPDDIETVARLLPLAHIEFAMSEADYFAGITGDRRDAAVAWDDYLIGHAEWFLSSPGRAFLEDIRALA